MNKKSLYELLKSGNFTVAYHDNGACSIYKGRHQYNYLPDEEVWEGGSEDYGYVPDIVELLTKALGGVVDSI